MPRPDPRAPKIGQESFELDIPERTGEARTGEVLRGRHSHAMDAALDAARSAELIGEVDGGAATILRAGAWALDTFEARGQAYGPAKLVPALTEALRELHMTPESRHTDTDDNIADLLRELAAAEQDDPSHGETSLPHTAP